MLNTNICCPDREGEMEDTVIFHGGRKVYHCTECGTLAIDRSEARVLPISLVPRLDANSG